MVRQKVKDAGARSGRGGVRDWFVALDRERPKGPALCVDAGWLTARCLIDVGDVRRRVDQSADVGAADGGLVITNPPLERPTRILSPGTESRVACTIATSFDTQARPSAGVAVSFSSLCSSQPP
jgi:hypothetical protein